MGSGQVSVNPIAAQEQASAIGSARDGLKIEGEVTFSSQTTISGNQSAISTFSGLKQAIAGAQGVLDQDIQSIHSTVSAFQRMDQQAKSVIESGKSSVITPSSELPNRPHYPMK